MPTLHAEARAALRALNITPKKRLGQNFLVHEKVIESILRLLDLTPEEKIIEIGPGLGFLTRRLVEKARDVYAVEVDPALVKWLEQAPFAASPGFHLIHQDILELPLDKILPPEKVKLAGNLPYSISTPVLFRLLDWREHFSSFVFMVQKEVAERIASRPGTKAYGTLSVWCQVHGRIAEKVQVGPEAFYPRPKVRSTILKLELYPEPLMLREELPVLRRLIRIAFGHRRKTLGSNLAGSSGRGKKEIESCLRDSSIDPLRRGETLSLDEFIRLTRSLIRGGFLSVAA